MNKWIKIFLVLAAIGILAALYVWFYVYNKPHRDYEKARPDHYLSAEKLFSEYSLDKKTADSLYTGMVLQIEGELNNVEVADTMIIAVFAFEQGMFGDEGVRCIILPGHHKSIMKYNAGERITLKGYCTGYNDTDVILEKTSVVREE